MTVMWQKKKKSLLELKLGKLNSVQQILLWYLRNHNFHITVIFTVQLHFVAIIVPLPKIAMFPKCLLFTISCDFPFDFDMKHETVLRFIHTNTITRLVKHTHTESNISVLGSLCSNVESL